MEQSVSKRIIRKLNIGIVPPCRSLMARLHLRYVGVLAMGKAMPFLFAKVKSQPFNGFIVKSQN